MPIIYRCSKCGSIMTVYSEGEGTWYGVPSPSDMVKYIGSKCPVCGKPLNTDVDLDKVIIEVHRQVRLSSIRRKRRGVEIEVKL
jgi:DNA-directed RNA polymerase subunit RPC12/RpoP